MESRKAVLERLPIKRESNDKWLSVLVLSFMTSEESGSEEDGQPTLYIKPLPWRSTEVTKAFKVLDSKAFELKSHRAKAQTFRRSTSSTNSERPKPGLSLKRSFGDFPLDCIYVHHLHLYCAWTT